MWKALTADSILPYALLGMTAVTGLVDAVSFLSLGHVFTANMTGNIVLLAFCEYRCTSGVPGPFNQCSLGVSCRRRGWRSHHGWRKRRGAASCGEFGFCIGDCFLNRGNSGRTWLYCRFISAFPTALRDDRFHRHSDGDEKCRRT